MVRTKKYTITRKKPAYQSTGRRSFRKYSRRRQIMFRTPSRKHASVMTMDNYHCTLNFHDYFQLTNVAGQSAYYQYAINDLYDPYYGVGGASILGFAQLSAIWSNYIVYAAKVTARVVRQDGPYSTYSFLQGLDSADTAAPTAPTYQSITMQQTDVAYRLVPGKHDDILFQQKIPVLKKYFSVGKLEGGPIKGNIEQYGALCTGSPTRICSFLIGHVTPAAYAANVLTQDFDLKIKFYCKFYNRSTAIVDPDT